MSVKLIVGTQWGDEGKGKIVDLLSQQADIVARYNGGPNAGHTVVIGGEETILHLIPCGILRPETTCVIGNGVVVDPQVLLTEIELLKSKGINCRDRLWISDRAHLILPYHKIYEKEFEAWQAGEAVGTTGRGIGFAYADKMERIGVRAGELCHPELLRLKTKKNLDYKNKIIDQVFRAIGLPDVVIHEWANQSEQITWAITDTSVLLNQAIKNGKNLLIEGAQGALLDIDHGTYPFVTSSNCCSGGACTGLGIGPSKINSVLGVMKAYTTRVGGGPFLTELNNYIGDLLQQIGIEVGATTMRKRRCGWLDLVGVNYAVRINGIDQLAITKLDVLDTLEEIKICIAYEIDGEKVEEFPADLGALERAKPVYRTFQGWQNPTGEVRKFGQLPKNARIYLDGIEELTSTKISIVSVGPEREQTIFVK